MTHTEKMSYSLSQFISLSTQYSCSVLKQTYYKAEVLNSYIKQLHVLRLDFSATNSTLFDAEITN